MKYLILNITFLVMSIIACAQTRTIDFVEYDMNNGLHVILHEDHSTPIVAVTVMYHVGSKNEMPERTGMAHFFEHLLFEGSENIGRGEYSRHVENAGGRLNANTTNDRTFYYELLPSNQLELGLWLESERMLHAKVENIGIETQREVVKEEKRMRVDNRPYGNLIEETMKRAYTEHPYQWTTIGSMEHLDAAQESEFIQFYKDFYVPNNAVLSIAGDFDIEECKELISKYFKDIPKSEKTIYRPTQEEPLKTTEVRDTILGDDRLPLVLMSYPIPAQGEPEFYAVDMMNRLLSVGESSRLNKVLVEQEQIAMFSGAFSFALEDPGQSMAFAMANIGVEPDQLEKSIEAEIQKIKDGEISVREIQKLKNAIEADFITGNASMASIAENLANYHMYYGSANLINTEIDKYLAVTKSDIVNAANKYYDEEQRVVLYFLFDENLSNPE